jgi:hypothetical protein
MVDNKTDWRLYFEIIGVLSIVASLVFVGLQIRQSARAAFEESTVGDAALIVDVESLVLEHPDAWRRGCMGESLEPAEALVFSHIHHAYTFNYYLRWRRATEGVEASSEWLGIDNIAMNIYRFPGFRAEWDAHGEARRQVDDSFPFQVFRQRVNERVAEYPAFEPLPLTDESRCGLN